MYTGYINKEVRAMYGIPYNQLTDEQKAILHADSKRRAKLIKEREEAVLKNNLKAFDDEAKMEKFLASLYKSCQKQILADVAETVAKVQKEGGTWSYANQSALTRSRGLFEQIQQELTKLGQAEEITFREGLGNIYTDQFLRQVYTLGQTITVNANFNRLNPALVRKTLDYPWSGAMFSDRIWLDKEQLGKNLRLGLTQSMILGEDMAHISQRINKNIDTSEYNAMRLARTETKRVTYVAHDDVMADCGVEKVKYRCANGGDSRTCKVCFQYNNEVFERGTEPQLPIHPNCRCLYVAEVEDTFKDNELNELTQSVRGAENFEKWKEAEAKKQVNLTVAEKADKVNKENVASGTEGAYNTYIRDIEKVRATGAVNRVTNAYFDSVGSPLKRVDLSKMDLATAKEVSMALVELDSKWVSTLQEVEVVDSLGFSVAGKCTPFVDVWERTHNDKDLYSRILYSWNEINPTKAMEYWQEDQKSFPYNYNSLVDKKNYLLQTIYHEYGHSILGGKVSEHYGTNKDAYGEIKKVYSRYKRAVSKQRNIMFERQRVYAGNSNYSELIKQDKESIEAEEKLKSLYISKYANESVGEFIAECFATANLNSNPSPYAVEVVEILERYFGKGGV